MTPSVICFPSRGKGDAMVVSLLFWSFCIRTFKHNNVSVHFFWMPTRFRNWVVFRSSFGLISQRREREKASCCVIHYSVTIFVFVRKSIISLQWTNVIIRELPLSLVGLSLFSKREFSSTKKKSRENREKKDKFSTEITNFCVVRKKMLRRTLVWSDCENILLSLFSVCRITAAGIIKSNFNNPNRESN